MKKIVCLFLVLSMLVVSVSAADVYDIAPDAVIMKSPVSTFSSGISPLVTGSDYSEDIYDWLDTTLIDMLTRADGYFISMDDSLSYIYTRLSSILSAINDVNSSVGTSNYWLQQIWGSISDFATEDTLFDVLSEVSDLDTVLTYISYIVASESTLLDVLYELEDIDPILSDISDKVATESSLSSLSSLLNSRTLISSGEWIVKSDGSVGQIGDSWSMLSFLNSGLQGLRRNILSVDSRLYVGSGERILSVSGQEYTLSGLLPLSYVMSNGLLGVRSLISGSESDNVYFGTITSNDNSESSFNATGLGPMLNKFLDAIQADTGRLNYMFASPADIKAKQDSESITGEMADSFLKADSKASIKLSDVGVLKDSSEVVQDLGQTGVTPGQAFSQLTGNSDLFSFFSEETAADLNTVPTVYSRDSGNQIVTSYYEDSRAAFFDLIGKGGDE